MSHSVLYHLGSVVFRAGMIAALVATSLLALPVPAARAQSPIDGFDPNANGGVGALAVQADGKIVVGGLFTQIGGQTRNRIARLNTDGTLDATFNPNADNSISALALQPDGKIVVGGAFTWIGGGARNRIARLNADGTLDATFNPNADTPSLRWRCSRTARLWWGAHSPRSAGRRATTSPG